jgi:predicted XRE-type DNA-binding protein
MRDEKRKRLERKGWKVGTVREFLGLSEAEEELVEIRIRLAEGLKRLRQDRGVTQAEVSRLVHSSQSRVAKMEAAEEMVSIDLLVRTLLALGASRSEVGGIIAGKRRSAA